MTILSSQPDGFGFFPGDRRQINVRREGAVWAAYVGGERLRETFATKVQAEAGAIACAKANPEADS